MYEYQLTIGLFDKDNAKQKISTAAAENMISDLLLNQFKIYAFTMINCFGVYKMADGRIVKEPSIRLEIASDEDISSIINSFINTIKSPAYLNQECILTLFKRKEVIKNDFSIFPGILCRIYSACYSCDFCNNLWRKANCIWAKNQNSSQEII